MLGLSARAESRIEIPRKFSSRTGELKTQMCESKLEVQTAEDRRARDLEERRTVTVIGSEIV